MSFVSPMPYLRQVCIRVFTAEVGYSGAGPLARLGGCLDVSRGEDGRYVCTVPALPGAAGDGETKGAAPDGVAEAIAAMREAAGTARVASA